jgi:adenine/guanine phosphoribosyltransferase-like PRPP-binding protein
VEQAAKALRLFRKKNPFDAIAFRGNSGAAIAYPLSFKLQIPLICVRKGPSHSPFKVEGCSNAKTYVIVDDFIESGNTIKRIRKAINTDYRSEPKLVGILLYDYGPPCSCKEHDWQGIPVIKI